MNIAEWTHRCPFRTSARNGQRRVPSAGGHYVRYLGSTNHARDDVVINQWKGKIRDNLETVPYSDVHNQSVDHLNKWEWWKSLGIFFEITYMDLEAPQVILCTIIGWIILFTRQNQISVKTLLIFFVCKIDNREEGLILYFRMMLITI